MKYFERNNKEFFMLFTSTRADLYFDVIEEFVRETRNKNELSKEDARVIVECKMNEYPDLCGEQVVPIDILNELENKKWIVERRSGIRDFYRLTPNALTQYKAMKQMDDERDGNNFEFHNAIAQVYHICNDFQTNKKNYLDKTSFFYTAFLKAINDVVKDVLIELQKCEADFEQQADRLNDKMELYELFNQMTTILNGNAMKNYYRLLNDDNRFMKYQQFIVDTLYDIKNCYNDALIDSYIIETNDFYENAVEEVELMLDSIINFFELEYEISKSNIAEIQKKCNKKINNRIAVHQEGASEDKDFATRLISKVVGEISAGKDLYDISSCELLSHLNFYELNIFEGEKSFRHKTERFSEIKVVAENKVIVNPEFEKMQREKALNEKNERIKHGRKSTIDYIKETYGEKERIYSSELMLKTPEEARRTRDIIRYALENAKEFPYRIEEMNIKITNEPLYMEILTPFVLIRKETK